MAPRAPAAWSGTRQAWVSKGAPTRRPFSWLTWHSPGLSDTGTFLFTMPTEVGQSPRYRVLGSLTSEMGVTPNPHRHRRANGDRLPRRGQSHCLRSQVGVAVSAAPLDSPTIPGQPRLSGRRCRPHPQARRRTRHEHRYPRRLQPCLETGASPPRQRNRQSFQRPSLRPQSRSRRPKGRHRAVAVHRRPCHAENQAISLSSPKLRSPTRLPAHTNVNPALVNHNPVVVHHTRPSSPGHTPVSFVKFFGPVVVTNFGPGLGLLVRGRVPERGEVGGSCGLSLFYGD